jgi:hypothetical protein
MTHVACVVLIVLFGTHQAVAQYQAMGTGRTIYRDYGGYWGNDFGIVGGPIVTVNGYLLPVYSDVSYYANAPVGFVNPGGAPTGFVNAGPVYGDWATGYDRLDPGRIGYGSSLGMGVANWGYLPSRPPLIPGVAGPPIPVVAPIAVPRAEMAVTSSSPVQPPRTLQPGQPAPADRTGVISPRVIERGLSAPRGEEDAPVGPRVIRIAPRGEPR